MVQVMCIARFLSAVALSWDAGHHTFGITLGLISCLAASVAAYVFNGIADMSEDSENGSTRPIASGRLPVLQAVRFTSVVAVLAMAAGIAAGIGVEVAAYLALGYLYSGPPRPAKRSGVMASIVIAGLGGTVFWAGAAASGNAYVADVVLFGTVMSAWMGMVGALLKDLNDVPGDAQAGRRTFAVLFGNAIVAYWAAASGAALAVGGVVAAGLLAPILLPSMAVFAAGATVVSSKSIHLARRGQGADLRAPYRAFMVVQYVSIAALWVTIIIGHAILRGPAEEASQPMPAAFGETGFKTSPSLGYTV